MKIWMLTTTEKCTAINSENHDDFRISVEQYFNNETEQWKPIKFVTRRKGNKSDCADFMTGFYPVFMKKAKNILSPLLGDGVEFLPIIHDEHEMYIVKVKNVQDFIDMSNPVERRINYGYFSEYVHIIREKVNHSIPIFRMPPHLSSRVYVTDTFKKTVEDNKLKGFEFIKLWDTEYTEEDRKERLKQFDIFYERISAHEIVDYSTAMDIVNVGKPVRCGKHVLKVKDNIFYVGQILEDESIQWVQPKFIAPHFLELQWMVYEEDNEKLLIEDFMAELSYEINGPKGIPISFEDLSLESIVRKELNIFKEELNDKNLLKLRSIPPIYKGLPVNSLKGIEHAHNLRNISINDNPNFDISELGRIPSNLLILSIIRCDMNSITKFKELQLPNLAHLDLSSNNIEDLSSLVGYRNLTRIDISSNKIKNIRPLNELIKLDSVNLRDNPVENIQELQLKKVRVLYLEGIRTRNWCFLLTNFPMLETVYISLEGMTAEEKKSIMNVKKQKKIKVVFSNYLSHNLTI